MCSKPSDPAIRVRSYGNELTDLCLIGLAVRHRGRFATFDAGIGTSPIPGGHAAHFIIPFVIHPCSPCPTSPFR